MSLLSRAIEKIIHRKPSSQQEPKSLIIRQDSNSTSFTTIKTASRKEPRKWFKTGIFGNRKNSVSFNNLEELDEIKKKEEEDQDQLCSKKSDNFRLFQSEEFQLLIEENDVNSIGEDEEVSMTSLHVAVELKSSLAVIDRLVKNLIRIDPFALNDEGDTALHIAARNYASDVCIYLVKLGFDPNFPNLRQKTPVQLVADYEKNNGGDLGYRMMIAFWTMLKGRIEQGSFVELALSAWKHKSYQLIKELSHLGADLSLVVDRETGICLEDFGNLSGNRMQSFSSVSKAHGRRNSTGLLDICSEDFNELLEQETVTEGLISAGQEEESPEEIVKSSIEEISKGNTPMQMQGKQKPSRFSIRDIPES